MDLFRKTALEGEPARCFVSRRLAARMFWLSLMSIFFSMVANQSFAKPDEESNVVQIENKNSATQTKPVQLPNEQAVKSDKKSDSLPESTRPPTNPTSPKPSPSTGAERLPPPFQSIQIPPTPQTFPRLNNLRNPQRGPINTSTGRAQPAGSRSAFVMAGGYIDPAMIANRVRFRFEAGYNNPFPDRGEFFYPACGCFNINHAPGPVQPEKSVNYQEAELYLEHAWAPRFSTFAEIPVRWIDPVANSNAAGLSDIQAGLRYALTSGPDYWTTAQLRVYTPTGDGHEGLGTAHATVEPALLCQRNLNDSLSVFSEARIWVPLHTTKEEYPLGTDYGGPGGSYRSYAGPVLRYGVGAMYKILESETEFGRLRANIIPELVGWTFMEALKERTLTPTVPVDSPLFVEHYASARGDTIINAKLGLRFNTEKASFYIGYGHALLTERMYAQIVRAELTFLY